VSRNIIALKIQMVISRDFKSVARNTNIFSGPVSREEILEKNQFYSMDA
jgi:hypothetical protein